MIGSLLEVYIDDIVVKSEDLERHMANLRKAFERMWVHNLKMNPPKCAFKVSAGNFLAFGRFLVH